MIELGKFFKLPIGAVEIAAVVIQLIQISFDVIFQRPLKFDQRIILDKIIPSTVRNQPTVDGMHFADKISVAALLLEKFIERVIVADLDVELTEPQSDESGIFFAAHRALETRNAEPNPRENFSVGRRDQIGLNVFDLILIRVDECRVRPKIFGAHVSNRSS